MIDLPLIIHAFMNNNHNTMQILCFPILQFHAVPFYCSHYLYRIEHSFWSASFATTYHKILVPPFLSHDLVSLRDSRRGTVSECPRLSMARANDQFGSYSAPLCHFRSPPSKWMIVSRATRIVPRCFARHPLGSSLEL